MNDNNNQTTMNTQDNTKIDYDEKMLEAFTGKPDKVQWYKRAFMKYDNDGVEAMRWNWSWWAFIGNFWFLLYRKAYMAAFLLFIIMHVALYFPVVSFLIAIAAGGLSTYFIYKIYKRSKFEIEVEQIDDHQRISTMRRIGEYHQWVIYLAVVYYILVILGVVDSLAPELLGR